MCPSGLPLCALRLVVCLHTGAVVLPSPLQCADDGGGHQPVELLPLFTVKRGTPAAHKYQVWCARCLGSPNANPLFRDAPHVVRYWTVHLGTCMLWLHTLHKLHHQPQPCCLFADMLCPGLRLNLWAVGNELEVLCMLAGHMCHVVPCRYGHVCDGLC